MPLSSWKDVLSAFSMSPEDWRADDLKNFMIEYVADRMDIETLASEHPEMVYEDLINKVANRYHFVHTSDDYPDTMTQHEKVLRAYAMRLHNANRALSSKSRRSTKRARLNRALSTEGTTDNSRSASMSGKRKDSTPASQSASSSKRRRERESSFLETAKAHGSVMSTFSAKLILTLNGEEKVDAQIEALKAKTFAQVGVFVRDVAETTKPVETRWQIFVANEVMWEHSKGI